MEEERKCHKIKRNTDFINTQCSREQVETIRVGKDNQRDGKVI